MREELTQENLDLRGASFKGVNLENAKFCKTALYGCDFTNANLHNVKFTLCKLINCKFDYSNLLWAEFKDTTIENCSFTGAELIGVKGLDVSQVHRELAGETGRHNFRVALYIDGSRKPSVIKTFKAPIVPDGTLCPTAHEIFREFIPSGDGNFKGDLDGDRCSCTGIKVKNGIVAHKWVARLEMESDDLWLHKSYWTEIGRKYTTWVWKSDIFVK